LRKSNFLSPFAERRTRGFDFLDKGRPSRNVREPVRPGDVEPEDDKKSTSPTRESKGKPKSKAEQNSVYRDGRTKPTSKDEHDALVRLPVKQLLKRLAREDTQLVNHQRSISSNPQKSTKTPTSQVIDDEQLLKHLRQNLAPEV